MKDGKIVSFTDLNAWQEAHKLRMAILKHITVFPHEYRFGLCAQLQRSAISIGSNIAEGFGRRGRKEKLQFYNISCGSLTEVQDQLIICRDLELIDGVTFKELAEQTVVIHKLLRGLMKSLEANLQDTNYKLPSTARSDTDG